MKIIFVFLLGIAATLVGEYLFVFLGGMPVATKGEPLPFERLIVRTAMHAALKIEKSRPAPIIANEENMQAGAKIYRNNCVLCHALPGQEASPVAKGMFPMPPQLFDKDDMVTDDPVGAIFWKTKNGIRLTGMPGFSDSLSDKEVWQVALLLSNADKIPVSVQGLLKPAETSAPLPPPTKIEKKK